MRLTKKEEIKELATLKKYNVLMTDDDYKELKLGQLEDIEDELGIDLITLFKALKNGIYVSNDKYNTDKCYVGLAYDFEHIENKRWSLLGFAYGYEAEEFVFLKDYGKTWALTKEELGIKKS